jgi:uncharacterized protein
MDHMSIQQTFTAALDSLVEELKRDQTVLAAVLCGSLSHDTVWAKSDIDLLLVTLDDGAGTRGQNSVSLNADGVNIHAVMIQRAEFRKIVDGATQNSFIHALLVKGRLLYTHDPTIADLCATLSKLGQRDKQLQLLRAATHVLAPMYKARKWFVTRGDLEYTALWILNTATPLARLEVIGAGLVADREALPQALKLNPALFTTVYTDLLNTPKTKAGVQAALKTVETYIAERARTLFALVIDYLREVGDARSCTEIEAHFKRNFDVGGITTACEYLADEGLIGKASTPVRLTKKSNIDVQELAFFYLASS